MKLRQFIIIGIFAMVVVLTVFLSRRMQMKAEQNEAEGRELVIAPLRVVKARILQNERHVIKKPVSGKLVAKDRQSIYADVAGRMLSTKTSFRKGNYFKSGEVILQLDRQTEILGVKAMRTQLFNAIAAMLPDLTLSYPDQAIRWEAYLEASDEKSGLLDLPEVSDDRARLFLNSRGIYQSFYQIKAEESRIAKFTVRAPISGILTEALVYPGSFVQPGQKLGEIMGTRRFEMEVTLALDDLTFIKGKEVEVLDHQIGRSVNGRVSRINPIVDEATQSITAIVDLEGKGLYHGMYLEGTILEEQLEPSMRIDRSLLLPGNTVFIIEGNSLSRQNVEVIAYEEGHAFVRGLEDGVSLLDETSASFRPGLQVRFE